MLADDQLAQGAGLTSLVGKPDSMASLRGLEEIDEPRQKLQNEAAMQDLSQGRSSEPSRTLPRPCPRGLDHHPSPEVMTR